MSKRHTGIKIALATLLAGAIGLPGLAAARGDGDWGGGQRGNWDQGRRGQWEQGYRRDWDGGRDGRGYYRGPRHHPHGHRYYDRRPVVVERPAYLAPRPPMVVAPLVGPVIAPWGGARNGATVILHSDW